MAGFAFADDEAWELRQFRQRAVAAALVVLLTFVVLFGRFVYLQVFRHDYYLTRAQENRISIVPVVPQRGMILDRKGTVLARNDSAFTLEITPARTPDLTQTIDLVAQLISIDARDRRRFRKLLEESKNFESLPLKVRLSDEEVARVSAQLYRLPGVEVKARQFRQYPFGGLASHALGHMGRISERDREFLEGSDSVANYRGTDHIGKLGLENAYELDLHGTTGYQEVETDAGGRAVRVLSRTAPTPGSDITLTLDADLQAVAEAAIGDRRGAAVAIDPNSGGVLAFVSTPTFDPNLFVDGIGIQEWDELNTSPDRPMLNRALAGTYPPGSTFKPYMALAALTLGKRTPQQAINDGGLFVFGNHVFRDDKVGGHGIVDMHKSIVESCNTYYYVLANDLGIDAIDGFIGPFGFGRLSGIDIPGELEGVLPSQEWKRKRFRTPEQQRWFPGETISVGIGQGYNAYTPLQLALAVATLANGGTVYRPHLVAAIGDRSDGSVVPVAPEVVRKLPLKKEHVAVIHKAMIEVNREGTGRWAFAKAPYVVAGKTGTAQVYSLRGEKYDAKTAAEELKDHSLFIAFAPAEAPTIAVAVVVENAGFGATAAAPVARQIIDHHLLDATPEATGARP
jgi:penicillin-binding protein 2